MLPDFIGIGAQKSATTWLYEIFNLHPSVWMPPTKELHFFNNHEGDYSHFNRILYRRARFKQSINRFKYTPLSNLNWAYKYLFKKRSFENYTNLFTPKKGQIAGEITPAYGLLDEMIIGEIQQVLPHLKIIYILRNPIYRNWSSICMNYKNANKYDLSSVPSEELIEKSSYTNRLSQSDYTTNLERWEKHFDSKQIFIGFYEEIQNQPISFLNRLFDFLDLSSLARSAIGELLQMKINTKSMPISNDIKKAITKAEYTNIERSHLRFRNRFTADWMNEASSILNV